MNQATIRFQMTLFYRVYSEAEKDQCCLGCGMYQIRWWLELLGNIFLNLILLKTAFLSIAPSEYAPLYISLLVLPELIVTIQLSGAISS